MGTKYADVTELPGIRVTKEQLERLFHRYHFAVEFCKDKDVLEVACGAGLGLGYLARRAKKVFAGDIDENNLSFAQEYYLGRDNIDIKILDAHKLPFEDSSFDVVILYEALYYLAQPERFIQEVHRILRREGMLIICTVNKSWSDFNPSPFSIKYFSAPELFSLLSQAFSKVELYGSFPGSPDRFRDKIISFIKKTAIVLNLMPKTMKGKEIFKRIFSGRLLTLPPEIEEGMAEYYPPVPIPYDSPNFDYKVLYAVAHIL